MRNKSMAPIGDRLNNICAGHFIGWTHEGKTRFIILTHGFPLPPTGSKTTYNAVRPRSFVVGYLDVYAIALRKRGDTHIGDLHERCPQNNREAKAT